MSSSAKRVLIVDDEPSMLKIIGKRREVAGFAVSVAMDGQAALIKVQQEPPDLIILDVMMPQLSGFDVCTRLKQDPRFRHIPIVMFTAKDQEEDYWKGKACGADAFISKPSGGQALEHMVSRLIEALKEPPQE
jgi:DNA-binding response OmpR family regulator